MTGPLSKAKVDAHLADQERELEVMRGVEEQLRTLADDEYREIVRKEGQLARFRQLVEERGVVEP